MLINSNLFSFNFFLGGRKQVNSLEQGAIDNGGATKINNKIYSNIETNEYIKVNNEGNTISILIPSTLNTDKQINNTKYVKRYNNILNKFYNSNDIIYYSTQGSWYSEDLQKVVVENITIISLNIKKVTVADISLFNLLALQVKKDMKQEGVSVLINDALCIA